jgi:predicted RND superfamily exporter protein
MLEACFMSRHLVIDGIVTAAFVLCAGISLALAGFITVDSSTEAFMPEQDPVVVTNGEIEQRFGTTDAIIVGVRPHSNSVLDGQTLALIDRLSTALGELEAVDEVLSLTNAQHIVGSPYGMEVVALYDPDEGEAVTRLQERLADWPEAYDGNLVSVDRSMATIIVRPLAGIDTPAQDRLLDSVRAVIASGQSEETSISIVGLPVIKQEINRSLMADLVVLAPIVAIIIVAVLYLSFKRLTSVIFPLLALFVAAALIVAVIALSGITFTMATMLVPVLLLVVGSAYGIHVMSHFQAETAVHGDILDSTAIEETVSHVIRRNLVPVMLAGATTMAGFIAQLSSPLGPFRTFGLLSAAGVVLTQLTALVLIPALIRLTYRHGLKKPQSQQPASRWHLLDRLVVGCFRLAKRHQRVLLAVASLALVALACALPCIDVGTDMLAFFHKDTRLVRDTELFDTTMNGAGILAVMVEGPRPGDVVAPDFLMELQEFSTMLEHKESVGATRTIVPYIKRINRMMNWDSVPYAAGTVGMQTDFDFFAPAGAAVAALGADGMAVGSTPKYSTIENVAGSAYDEIPQDSAKYGLEDDAALQALISQYLVLYAGNLTMFIDDAIEPAATLVTIQVRDTSNDSLRALVQDIDSFWNGRLDAGWTVRIGGGEAVSLALVDLVTRSQIVSIVFALLIVWVMVSLMWRSAVAGLLSLVPVIAALSGVFTTMAILGIHVDIVTSLLASIAIGTGVDYAIHFMGGCRHLVEDSGRCAMEKVFSITGRAIIINALSVTLGFSGLIFSRFVPIQQLGILFAVSTICAGLASLTILPMLIDRINPKFLSPRQVAHGPRRALP